MAILDELAAKLYGRSRAEENIVSTDATTRTYIGTATSDSSDGSVYVALSEDVTMPDDYDGEHGVGVEMPTTVGVSEGDDVVVTVFGGGTMKAPVVTGNPGWGDDVDTRVTEAHDLAASVEGIAQEAAAEVEQVRQDVADFRSDVATTYATKVERQDGDDAVKTWVTTNYTNSNDLATTYATKTLVSQTKDAIELAASQTYETQSDAAETYATKSALTVGLDGIRSEVAEDYQPKGDYATTASMNSAIQQSASSIESSVAATYETKSDAATTYATKTDVQQTASGLDTRITTATNTANSAKSAVDNLQVGGTNLAIGSKDFAFASQAAKTNRYVGVQYSSQTFRTRSDGFVETVARSNWNGISVYANALDLSVGDTVTLSVDARNDATVGNTLAFYAMAYNSSGTRLFGSILGLETRNGSNAGAGDISIYPSNTFSPGAHDRVWVKITWLQRAQDIVDAGGRIALTIQATAATSSNTNVSFWAVKLEHGNTPTSWSPAPEDMATEADLQAEVTERQTLIRQFSGGVLAGYVGNAIAALVNAAGSFDVVRTAWSGGVPSILGTLATFGANLIRIGEETGQNVLITSAGQFFRNGLNNLLSLTTGKTYTETFQIRADEDYYYELTYRPMVVESVTVDGNATSDYLWTNSGHVVGSGKLGTLVLGYDTWSANPGATLSVTYRTSPAMTVWDGLGNLAANIMSYFTADEIGLGGNIFADPHGTSRGAAVRFFGATDEQGASLTSGIQRDSAADYISYVDTIGLTGTTTDEGAALSNGCIADYGITAQGYLYDDSESSNDYRAESTANLYSRSRSSDAYDAADATARLGVKTITIGDSGAYSYVTLGDGTGEDTEVPLAQAIVSLTRPMLTRAPTEIRFKWSGTDGWHTMGLQVLKATTGSIGNYVSLNTEHGTFTARVGCTVRVSGTCTWIDGIYGTGIKNRRSLGVFINPTVSGSTVSGGTENSATNYFPSNGTYHKSVTFAPKLFHLNAGNTLVVARWEPPDAVNEGLYGMTWFTVEVVAVD